MTTIRITNDALATPGKALNIVLWTLQVLVALAFVALIAWGRRSPLAGLPGS